MRRCFVGGASVITPFTETTAFQLEALYAMKGEFKTVDVGWVFGGGLAFAAGRRAITIGARYEVGLRNITTVGDTKNRALSLVASVEVPLPRRQSGATRGFRRVLP